MKLLDHIPQLTMTKTKLLLTIALSCICAPFFFWIGLIAKADNTIGDLQDSKSMLLLRIEQTKAEYSALAAERSNAVEWCNIANQKGEEMSRLNALNESRRTEIQLIDQKLSSLMESRTQNR